MREGYIRRDGTGAGDDALERRSAPLASSRSMSAVSSSGTARGDMLRQRELLPKQTNTDVGVVYHIRRSRGTNISSNEPNSGPPASCAVRRRRTSLSVHHANKERVITYVRYMRGKEEEK